MKNRYFVSHESKRDYLIGKMIDGAMAMREFFSTVNTKYSSDPIAVKKEICSKYDLTKNQKRTLDKVASRVSRAGEIIRHLEKEYGLTKRGCIRDKKGLYRLVFGEEPPKGYFSATPLPFTICFYLPEERFRDDVGGNAANIKEWSRFIDSVLDKNVKSIRKGKKLHGGLQALGFTINYRKLASKMKNGSGSMKLKNKTGERYLSWGLKQSLGQSMAVAHEKKHVIDLITGKIYEPQMRELSADLFVDFLYDGSDSISRDADRLQKELDRYKRYSLRHLSEHRKLIENTGDSLKPTAEKLYGIFKKSNFEEIERMEREIQKIRDFPLEVIEAMEKKGMEHRTTSYLVSTIPLEKLEKRLRMAYDYLERSSAGYTPV